MESNKDFVNYLLTPIMNEIKGVNEDNNYIKQIRPFYNKLIELDKDEFIAFIFGMFNNKNITPEQTYRIIGERLPTKEANSELSLMLLVTAAEIKTGKSTYNKLDEEMVQLLIAARNKEKFNDTKVYKVLASQIDENGHQVMCSFKEPKENIAELMMRNELQYMNGRL
ncbi:MAG: hypothetical protein WC783_03430 [Candidatus Paceibacterota bacterium]|jgi:hypothetical protein